MTTQRDRKLPSAIKDRASRLAGNIEHIGNKRNEV